MITGRSIAVIGSGFGGLGAAIRLQAQGFNVTLFEQRDLPGGRAYVYEQDGFTFDAGPTVITAPLALEELFETCGKKLSSYVELIRLDPMYRLRWEDGVQFDYTDDTNKTLGAIAKLSPGDVQGYKQFIKYTDEVFEEGYTKLCHVPIMNWGKMIRLSPQLLRLKAYRSVYSIVSHYIKSRHLREAFSFHSLLVGGNPFTASSIYTLIHSLERRWGVYYAKGGTNALVRALVNLFLEQGGTLRLKTPVQQILTDNGRVTGLHTSSGVESFDAVVSNADVHHTYHRLLSDERAVQPVRRKLKRARYSMSLFVLYFGTKRQYPDVPHHCILFGARYKELLRDIFSRGNLADDFSLYLHRPTATDGSVAPKGCDNFYVLSPVPHLGKADIDWKVQGPRYAKRILEYLEKYYLPDLGQNIVTQRIFTPNEFKDELNSHVGSAFSLEPRLTQSAYFRIHNRDDRLSNLYFVGAGTHPGAGIPGVLGSAKATASLVAEDFGRQLATETSKSGSKLETAVIQSRQAIAVGSKSFALASKVFSSEQRNAASLLYHWCRYCDDRIDQVNDRAEQLKRLEELKAAVSDMYARQPSTVSASFALSQVASKYQIPAFYPLELLEGMQMDIDKTRYKTVRDLELYCYRVASTVGLMMCHVMGISRETALQNASALGAAMQLTNISRDVIDDWRLGRVYLPLQWLGDVGLDVDRLADRDQRDRVAMVVKRLLDRADQLYRLGNAGLRYLPLRAAVTVGIASSVYRQIGIKVRRRGAEAWDTRTVVTLAGKIIPILRGVGLALMTVPYRLWTPWQSVRIAKLWRHV